MAVHAGAVVMDKTLGARLCQAAFNGDVPQLKQAQQAGVDINVADYDGRTGKHTSCIHWRYIYSFFYLYKLYYIILYKGRTNTNKCFINTPALGEYNARSFMFNAWRIADSATRHMYLQRNIVTKGHGNQGHGN